MKAKELTTKALCRLREATGGELYPPGDFGQQLVPHYIAMDQGLDEQDLPKVEAACKAIIGIAGNIESVARCPFNDGR